MVSDGRKFAFQVAASTSEQDIVNSAWAFSVRAFVPGPLLDSTASSAIPTLSHFAARSLAIMP